MHTLCNFINDTEKFPCRSRDSVSVILHHSEGGFRCSARFERLLDPIVRQIPTFAACNPSTEVTDRRPRSRQPLVKCKH